MVVTLTLGSSARRLKEASMAHMVPVLEKRGRALSLFLLTRRYFRLQQTDGSGRVSR